MVQETEKQQKEEKSGMSMFPSVSNPCLFLRLLYYIPFYLRVGTLTFPIDLLAGTEFAKEGRDNQPDFCLFISARAE